MASSQTFSLESILDNSNMEMNFLSPGNKKFKSNPLAIFLSKTTYETLFIATLEFWLSLDGFARSTKQWFVQGEA